MTAILDRRGRWNLRMNLLISTLLVFFGVSSLVVSALSKAEENFFLEFRYMTVNGTVFTTLISLIIAIVCVTQMATGRQLRLRQLSYLRLCSAVTETIIGVVILLSLFPFVPDNPNILTYDSFSMHVIIPLLSILSFLLNRSPVESIHPLLRLNCAWLITLYAAVVIALILGGLIPQEKIPYSFLEFNTRPIGYFIYFGCFIYSFTYVLSFLLTEGNKRLSRLWAAENQKPIRSR